MADYATQEDVDRYVNIRDEMDDALSVSVKVGWREVMRVIASDLINKRNACRDPELQEAFDKILRGYYLSEEEHKAATKPSH